MTWAALHAMIDALPTRVRCFGVHAADGTMIASAICLLVNPTTLYVFYWGEIAGVESLSPVTLLAQCLFDHCKANAISLLDLGTSTVKGAPNEGLLRYKRHLGARISLKLTMHKALT
jgi:predicted N-acyltransferase